MTDDFNGFTKISTPAWIGCSCDLRRLSKLGIVVITRDYLYFRRDRLPSPQLSDAENSELSIMIELSKRSMYKSKN